MPALAYFYLDTPKELPELTSPSDRQTLSTVYMTSEQMYYERIWDLTHAYFGEETSG